MSIPASHLEAVTVWKTRAHEIIDRASHTLQSKADDDFAQLLFVMEGFQTEYDQYCRKLDILRPKLK